MTDLKSIELQDVGLKQKLKYTVTKNKLVKI